MSELVGRRIPGDLGQDGTDAGREALERNLADHVPQAEAAVTGELSTELDTDLLTAVDAGSVDTGAVDGNGEEAG